MVLAVLARLGSGTAVAQTTTGEISGVVIDAQRGVLPGVAVVAVHLATGARVERLTDQDGTYRLPALAVGTYSSCSLSPRRSDTPERTARVKPVSVAVIFGTPNFGRVISAKSPREMQLGVRVTF